MKVKFKAICTMYVPNIDVARYFEPFWKEGKNTMKIDGKEYYVCSFEASNPNDFTIKFTEVKESEHEIEIGDY